MKYTLFILLISFCSCHTAKTITEYIDRVDSSAKKEVDRLRLDSASVVNTHQLEIEELKKSKVTISEPCDTIILPSNFNADSAVKVINALKSTVRYYKDGSYEVTGKISSLTTSNNAKQTELDSLASHYEVLQTEHQDSLIELHKLRQLDQTVKKVTVIPWWVWLICAAGLFAGWRLGKIKL